MMGERYGWNCLTVRTESVSTTLDDQSGRRVRPGRAARGGHRDPPALRDAEGDRPGGDDQDHGRGDDEVERHLGVDAIASSEPGDVIAIDNRGDLYNNCWGEILSYAAQKKGVAGVFVDGAARDIDFCQEIGFPVFARAVVPITARGRIMQEDFNCPIRLGDVQVRPGDILVGDVNGIVVIPPEKLDEVLKAAEEILEKEGRCGRTSSRGWISSRSTVSITMSRCSEEIVRRHYGMDTTRQKDRRGVFVALYVHHLGRTGPVRSAGWLRGDLSRRRQG